MSELLPCPFCGGEAVFQLFDTTCNVECTSCNIGTRFVCRDDYKQAINAWNTRTPEQAIAATLGSDDYKQAADYWKRMYEESFIEPVSGTCEDVGGRECKIISSSTNNLMYPDYMTKWYELSCGHSVTLKGSEPPRFCPKCGKVVNR